MPAGARATVGCVESKNSDYIYLHLFSSVNAVSWVHTSRQCEANHPEGL